MKILLSFLCLLLCLNCFSQEANSPYPSAIAGFIPPGWIILSSAQTDLNKDTLTDHVLILQSQDTIPDSSTSGYYFARTLIVLFQKADLTLEKSVETQKLFGDGNWGVQSTDPFVKMLANNGRINISFSTGGTLRAYMTYSFIYQNNTWILSQYDSEVYEWNNPERDITRYYFLTGIQEDLRMNKTKTLRKKISTIDYNLHLNSLEKRIYSLTELDASNFINPFKGDPAFED